MSSEPSPGPADTTVSDKQPRSPMERLIVWGLIIVLLVVVGAEAMARFGYENSLQSIEAALAADEAGDPLLIEELSTHISGFPSRDDNTKERVLTYTWRGVLKTYGSIEMPYSQNNEVLSFATAEAPLVTDNIVPTEEEMLVPSEDDAPGGGGSGEGGEGGGRRRFDPMQRDADGDGKISRDEASERMQENFDAIDTNGDGFAEQAELETYFANRRAEGGRRGGGGEGGDRPQRPQRPDNGASNDDTSTENAPEPDAKPETEETTPES